MAQSPGEGPVYRVRQLVSGGLYLDGGSESGIAEGMQLQIRRRAPGAPVLATEDVALVRVVAVARRSALCEVISGAKPVAVGDFAELTAQDAQAAAMLRESDTPRGYAQVVSFTDGEALEEEFREYVPKPPLPEINRVRGRISAEFGTIHDRQGGGSTNQEGIALRMDMTRIGGSFWNFTGYWRGRRNARSTAGQGATLADLINRTYHIGVFYNNPNSRNVMGFGRLLLPWASSLNTIDGGYYARRLNGAVTAGAFAGSTPDPTAWNYNANRQISGAFLNWQAGSFEGLRYTGTAGPVVSRVRWRPEREYLFVENSILYKDRFSLFHNVEVDRFQLGRFGSLDQGVKLSRSFLTFRAKASDRVSFDVSHNYFRWVPTFDSRLIGVGLVDQLLFQGLSAGLRVDATPMLSLYTTLGRSKREQDIAPSWNSLYGVTYRRLPWIRVRGDLRFARFQSDFGTGDYTTLGLTKEVGQNFRIDLQIGEQHFQSSLSNQTRARYGNANLEWLFGEHYVLGGGVLIYRGNVQAYDQIFFNTGYRF
jgi:hypothetical protein